jgi:hypothetical protein
MEQRAIGTRSYKPARRSPDPRVKADAARGSNRWRLLPR